MARIRHFSYSAYLMPCHNKRYARSLINFKNVNAENTILFKMEIKRIQNGVDQIINTLKSAYSRPCKVFLALCMYTTTFKKGRKRGHTGKFWNKYRFIQQLIHELPGYKEKKVIIAGFPCTSLFYPFPCSSIVWV